MFNTKIMKAFCLDATNQHYQANGHVVRVFDSNSAGDLIPVSFVPMGEQFLLHAYPYGEVYAEISYQF